MTRAAILIADGFQDEEGIYAYHRMIEEGWHVDVATPGTWRNAGKTVKGRPESIFGKFGCPLHITKLTEELSEKDYDVVVIPGGFKSPDVLRMDLHTLTFVIHMFANDRLVAAQCHGPWVLISAGVVRNRRATCYESLRDDLANAGARYRDERVVVDRNLITAQHYKDNGPFMRAVVEYFK